MSEVSGLSDWQLLIARNEIYARHGLGFKDESLRGYFQSKSWYHELYSADSSTTKPGAQAIPTPRPSLRPASRTTRTIARTGEGARAFCPEGTLGWVGPGRTFGGPMPTEVLLAILIVLLVAALVVAALALVRLSRAAEGAGRPAAQAPELSAMLERQFAQSRELQRVELSQAGDGLSRLADQMAQLRAETARGLETVRADNAQSLERVRMENAQSIERLRAENAQALEAMRATVDEKLERTLNERLSQSFARVDARLQQVDRGLGEMQGLAQGVGDLKRVLSNVKARGIVGEVQLGAILREVLAPVQFAENVATVPGSSERVEYAVRIPGEDGQTVWLPIDAKFPGDSYEHLRAVQEEGDAAAVEAAWKVLETRLRTEAKDIHDKYVAPPATTAFGVLFLPFEGLYAEVANRPGLLERLQRESRVSVAGPSTMAALLNSLEMGFQAVAIQRRADEIQRTLAAVKTEFVSYQTLLLRAQKQLGTATRTIDSLVGTRARAMDRALASVTLPEGEQAGRLSTESGVSPAVGAAGGDLAGKGLASEGAANPNAPSVAGEGSATRSVFNEKAGPASDSRGAHFR